MEEIKHYESDKNKQLIIPSLESRAKEARELSVDLAKDKANKPYNPDQKGPQVREHEVR